MSLSWVSRQRQAQRTSFPTSPWPRGLRNPPCPRPRGSSPAAGVRHSPQASRDQGRRRGDLIPDSRCFSGPCGSSNTPVLQLHGVPPSTSTPDSGHGRRRHRGPLGRVQLGFVARRERAMLPRQSLQGLSGPEAAQDPRKPQSFPVPGTPAWARERGAPTPLTAKQRAQEGGEEALVSRSPRRIGTIPGRGQAGNP